MVTPKRRIWAKLACLLVPLLLGAVTCLWLLGRRDAPSIPHKDETGKRVSSFRQHHAEEGNPPDSREGARARSLAQARIAEALGSREVPTMLEVDKSYSLPFLGEQKGRALEVRHQLALRNSSGPLKMRVLFSFDGSFLRAESLTTMDDPRRMDVKIIEKGLKDGLEAITKIPVSPTDFRLSSVLQQVCVRYDMTQAKEFNLSLVEYKFHDNTRRTVLILNVWGLDNPLQMRSDAPPILRNRVRVLLDTKGNIIRADNLL